MILLNTENKFMTKERPILFSAPMVLAILDGRKTQTRRIAKVTSDGCKEGFITPLAGFVPRSIENHFSYCPYGKPGDRLWVRETFAPDFEHNRYFYRADCDDDGTVPHLINGSGLGGGVGNAQINKWKPSINMPRAASRILLEVTNVRVERLQDISHSDAVSEGIYSEYHRWTDPEYPLDDIAYRPSKNSKYRYSDARQAYEDLWESISGPGSWDLNPWVWVVEFKVLETGK